MSDPLIHRPLLCAPSCHKSYTVDSGNNTVWGVARLATTITVEVSTPLPGWFRLLLLPADLAATLAVLALAEACNLTALACATETVAQYMAELQKLADKCKFGDYLEQAL